jgi:CheY-like chemotaxis protein
MPTILLVDDDDDFRSMLRDLLTRSGYTVVEAQDGKDGLRKCTEHSPDLVITDIIMPEQDGTGLILELKNLQTAPPIIAISGGGKNKGSDYLQIAKMFGARQVFEKPINNRAFLDTIGDLLGQH